MKDIKFKGIRAAVSTLLSILMAATLLVTLPSQALAAPAAAEASYQLVVQTPTNVSSFMIPTSSYLNGTNVGKSYDWFIDWGDGNSQSATGVSSQGGGIPHTYINAGTYTITISPNGSTEAWLAAFGFYNTATGSNSAANKAMLVALPSAMRPEMMRTAAQIDGTSPAPSFEWTGAFVGCDNLVEAAGFEGWEGISSVGQSFAAYLFYNCGSLSTLKAGFNLPPDITSVSDDFVSNMFGLCQSLVSLPPGFNLPQGIDIAPDYFATSMFYACSSLESLPAGFNLPQGIHSVGYQFADSIFAECAKLANLPAGFNLPQGITAAGNNFARKLFIGCNSLKSLPSSFNLPPYLSGTVGEDFCYGFFYECASLTTLPDGFNIPQGITSVGGSFANSMFYECTSLTRLPVGFNLPQGITTAGSNFARLMFYDCSSLAALPAGFSLPPNLNSNTTYFAERMFLAAGSPTFQINIEFRLPEGVPTSNTNNFYQTFNLSSQAPIQNRSAASLIGYCVTPTSSKGTFDGHFRDINYIPINWGGRGYAPPPTGAPRSGDFDGDGFVTMSDVLYVAQAALGGGVSMSPAQMAAIDMDGDGVFTMADVMQAYQRAL